MYIRPSQFVFPLFCVLLGWTFGPTTVKAQSGPPRCAAILQQLTKSLNEQAFKKIILLERQFLSNCKTLMNAQEYAGHLGTLASGLTGDRQYEEALSVAHQCVQISIDLSCLFEKANALNYLGRLPEAKSIIEGSLSLGAITVVDAAAKGALRNLLVQINAAADSRPSAGLPNTRDPNNIAPTRRSEGVVELNRAGPTCDPRHSSCSLLIQIRGEITDAVADQLERLIDKTRRKAEAEKLHFGFLGVELDSRGGSVSAAMAIGRILRREETGAWVKPGSVCLSSCVLILAGGTTRSFEGKIGIHRPYLPVPNGEVSTQDVRMVYQKMLQELRAYLREMNIVDGLADAMLRISPENIRLLSTAELASYGLTQVDPVWFEAFELNTAQSNGLNRQEYMRRKAIAESRCGGPMSIGTECYRNLLKNGPSPPGTTPDLSKYGSPQ